MRRAVFPPDPAVPSHLSATHEIRDKDAMAGTDVDLGDGRRAWPEGKVFAGAGAAVWTETEAEVRAGAGGKVFAETEIMRGTGAWAEVGAEWRPGSTEGGDLPSMPREPAAWLGQQTRRVGQRETAAFLSVPTMLAETVELQAPVLRKPLGLLSKAAWTKGSSSSSSKTSSSSTSSSTAKASSLPSSSSSSSSSSPSSSSISSSSSASNRESQTAASSNVSLVDVNSNSSNSNISSTLGMAQGYFVI